MALSFGWTGRIFNFNSASCIKYLTNGYSYNLDNKDVHYDSLTIADSDC
jgi:hypothetical protein